MPSATKLTAVKKPQPATTTYTLVAVNTNQLITQASDRLTVRY